MKVQKDSKIKFHYTVTTQDGEIVDGTDGEEALEAQLGQNELLPKLEENLIGMFMGEEKNIQIAPEDAFGEVMDDAICEIPRENIELTEEITEGMYIDLADENEEVFRGLVTKITEETVTIDFNHPLAGQVLNFKLKVEAIL